MLHDDPQTAAASAPSIEIRRETDPVPYRAALEDMTQRNADIAVTARN
jgi:hypothetical protein